MARLRPIDLDISGVMVEMTEDDQGVKLKFWRDGKIEKTIRLTPAQYRTLAEFFA